MISGNVVIPHYVTLGAYVVRFQELDDFKNVWADDVKCMKWPWNGDMACLGSRSSELQ